MIETLQVSGAAAAPIQEHYLTNAYQLPFSSKVELKILKNRKFVIKVNTKDDSYKLFENLN